MTKPICRLLFTLVVSAILSIRCLCADEQAFDNAISNFAENLATKVAESGRKKVAILDFSDLQGGSTELGRFVAEQVSVSLVEHRKGFAVMDRANLKTILAQHKLTVEGLVEPENAKQLGKFSDVDAIVLGSVTPFEGEIAVTAKIIATDTAEIAGAAKTRFPKAEIAGLSASRLSSENKESDNSAKKEVPDKTFGDLIVKYENIHSLKGVEGGIIVDLILKNKSNQNAIAVAAHAASQTSYLLNASLIAGDGAAYECESKMTGIKAIRVRPQNLTEIPAGDEIKTAFSFFPRIPSIMASQSVTKYRLQIEIVVNQNYKESQYENFSEANYERDTLPPFCKTYNLVMDIPVKMYKQE